MHRDLRSESSNKRQKIISAVLRFKKAFRRDVFRFNPFSTLRETSSCKSVNNKFVRHFDPRTLHLVSYSVEICHKIRHFLLTSATPGYDGRSVLKHVL